MAYEQLLFPLELLFEIIYVYMSKIIFLMKCFVALCFVQ